MSRGAKEVQLEDVLVTGRLKLRNKRAPDLRRENAALHLLARSLFSSADEMISNVLNLALSVCNAGSVGISTLDLSMPEPVFRWTALRVTSAVCFGLTQMAVASSCT